MFCLLYEMVTTVTLREEGTGDPRMRLRIVKRDSRREKARGDNNRVTSDTMTHDAGRVTQNYDYGQCYIFTLLTIFEFILMRGRAG